ncbi:probable receptor-like protein kinase At2g42960 [Cryptomeria japonica]|uniref:probable receptor-like protein kinase At2g42960 n=1 Tax=Cryptomeria japonica TaxID=3369 RepID=UPI0025ABB845|nr:probable receptor-like protein kinase At2g42960 [Cryptomeria japonica]XP_057852341.1 probable receptor-like protein kinase At2g42960 [Cryptomeria japonica]
MSSGGFLNAELSKKTSLFGLKLWVVIGIAVGAFIVIILILLSAWLASRRRSSSVLENVPMTQIPKVSKEIKEVKVEKVGSVNLSPSDAVLLTIDKSSDRESEKVLVRVGIRRSTDMDTHSQGSSIFQQEIGGNSLSGEEGNSGTFTLYRASSSHAINPASPLSGLPEVSHLGWGHWFTLRDLEVATNCFARENVLGEGGYGIVYKGQLANGTMVAVKNILNNLGQAEKEFRTEVEAIGHVRHKNLVRLLGYCIEGTHRMLVYEYVNNGNLDQWLHGAMRQQGFLTWEARMKVILGTAKALAYLHEAIEPKVVHRDIKASNILMDSDFNAKVSDFGLAKLLGSEKSHITTRVMGTFGYVAPEYANTGLLNEKSDVYSFGVLLLETITGRDPVDYGRPADEVNLVEWLKMMVGNRRSEEVVDPNIDMKPATRNLKRALLVALRCLDPDSEKRPKMGHVVRMLEVDEFPYHEDRRNRARHARKSEVEDEEKPIWQNTAEASASRDVDSHTDTRNGVEQANASEQRKRGRK